VGGIYQLRQKRGECRGRKTSTSLDPGRDGRSAMQMENTSEYCGGRGAIGGEFYYVATVKLHRPTTGTKMIHIGPRHAQARSSRRASRGCNGRTPTRRDMVRRCCRRPGARNLHHSVTRCVMGGKCGCVPTHFPLVEVKNPSADGGRTRRALLKSAETHDQRF